MKWLKRHQRLYAIGSVFVVIGGGLATIEGIWSLFSSEPLIPFILATVEPTLPLWSRWVFIMFFGSLTIWGIIILITIFRQTKQIPRKGIQPIIISKDRNDRGQVQLRNDIGLLIIEGTEVLKGFKSVHTFDDAWPTEEFKVWREKTNGVLLNNALTDQHALWFRDVGIDVSDSVLNDFIEACEAGLNRLEEILKNLSD